MKFSNIVFVLSVLKVGVFITEAVISENEFLFKYNNEYSYMKGVNRGILCSETVSYRASRLVPYMETYKERKWGIFYKTRLRWNYKTEYYTAWRKEYKCCDGYREVKNVDYVQCEPICQPSCGNGSCVKPNVCICHYGYSQKAYLDVDFICTSVCTHACIHGKCTAPEVCTCDHGYSLSSIDGYTCEPVCSFECYTGSFCAEPEHCVCLEGYFSSNPIATMSNGDHCTPICDRKCIDGTCTAPNTCTCYHGYKLDHDDLFTCKPKCDDGCLYGRCTAPNLCTCDIGYSLETSNICQPICSETCVMGICVAPESCSCFNGYGLLESSKYICEPVCEKACLNGKCTGPGVCTCNDGFRLSSDESEKHICKPYCKIFCEPFGVCTAPDICTCFEGYRLVDKLQAKQNSTEFFIDNSICEPICETACINGFCSSPGTCSCKPGYHLSGMNNNVCKFNCRRDCINGFCSAPEICTCYDGYYPSDIFWNVCKPFCEDGCINGYCSGLNNCTCMLGYQATNRTNLCEPICDPGCKNGVCTEPQVCSCNEGYRRSMYSASTCEPVCHPACDINGICKAPDLCVCKDGYLMIHYSNEVVPFKCEPTCSVVCGNGTCTAPNLCTCLEGYRNGDSGDCVPVCATCNNGTCVAPDVCECDDGFVLVKSDDEVRDSRSVSKDKPGNGSACVPRCKSCDNGECVATDECRCYSGFIKIEGTCVHACEGGCGTHGDCNEERRTCECNHGWNGLHCNQPNLCVLILNDEKNHTELLNIVEHNATIEHILMNNPGCPECISKMNNETLCFEMNINDTGNETRIGCLMNTECATSISKYKDRREIITISGIAGSSVILLLIGATAATYILLRKRRNKRMDLGNAHSTSMQGLVGRNSILNVENARES